MDFDEFDNDELEVIDQKKSMECLDDMVISALKAKYPDAEIVGVQNTGYYLESYVSVELNSALTEQNAGDMIRDLYEAMQWLRDENGDLVSLKPLEG